MAKLKKHNLFFKQAIIGFGFFNGLWMAVGIDPGDEVFKFLQPYAEPYGATIAYLFTILPTILLALSLWLIYKKGKWLGFAAVGLGFIGGLLILISPWIALGGLLAAWLIGYFAVR